MSSIPCFLKWQQLTFVAKTLITNFRACSCVKAPRAPPGENILPILIVIAIVLPKSGGGGGRSKMVFLCFSSRELRLSKFGAEFARRHTERDRESNMRVLTHVQTRFSPEEIRAEVQDVAEDDESDAFFLVTRRQLDFSRICVFARLTFFACGDLPISAELFVGVGGADWRFSGSDLG